MQKRALWVCVGLILILGAYLLSPSWRGPVSGAVSMSGGVRGNAGEPHRAAKHLRQPEVREIVGKSG